MDNRFLLKNNIALTTLTALLAIIIASTISNSGWTEGLYIVFWTGVGVAMIGILLSRSILPTLIAHLFSAIIGSGWAFWLTSRILPHEWSWNTRWENLITRIIEWYNIAVNGGVSYDNQMFILEMSLIVWLAGYFTIWTVFRHKQVWAALIPGGAVMLIVFHYAPENLTFFVLAYLIVSILLIIRFNLMEQELHWKANHVFYRPDVRYDFFRDGLLFSVVILIAAWTAPTLSATQTTELFSNFDRQWRGAQSQWNRLFANLDYKPDPLSAVDTFSQNLELGGPRQLTETPIMLVQAPVGRYWRAAVYDTYDGNGWTSQDKSELTFGENNPKVSLPFFKARVTVTQTFKLYQGGATVLYALANPVTVSRNAHAKAAEIAPREIADAPQNYFAGRRQPWYFEITYIESDRRLRAEEGYQVVSRYSVASKEQLQNDTAKYPAWVQERYTQLPEGIPQRVFDLAKKITTDKTTVFDKASAIEAYLRENIAYNEGIPFPPADRDKVDYILFDLKEAYCDYYATSMIVMLRSLGIPARLAAGYARGQVETLDNQETAYLVKNKDAHSWVEVFFPTYGWIEFEPTAAQPVIARSTGQNSSDAANLSSNTPPENPAPIDRVRDVDAEGNLSPTPEPPIAWQFALPFWGNITIAGETVRVIRAGIFTLVLLSLLSMGVLYLRRLGILNFGGAPSTQSPQNLPAVSAIYGAMVRLAGWMGIKKRPWQTAYEHASQLKRTVPEAQSEIELITTAFVRQAYSPRPDASPGTRQSVMTAWEHIRPLLFRTVFENRNPLRSVFSRFRW